MDSAVASYETMFDVKIVEEVLHRSNPLPSENNSEDEITLLLMTAMQEKEMLE
ncbi:1590_t:CDS:1, partial [Acaulospora morrowiae]